MFPVLLQSERLANLDHLQGPDAKPDFELLVEFDIAASDAITTGSCENLGIQSGGRMLRTLDELLEMDQLKVATAVGSRSRPTDHPRARRERAEKALQHPDCSAILRRKLQAGSSRCAEEDTAWNMLDGIH
ncbi:unnamed protein product [Effrenium voratum]|nr:unnamed protein product [Effrenium voratum]